MELGSSTGGGVSAEATRAAQDQIDEAARERARQAAIEAQKALALQRAEERTLDAALPATNTPRANAALRVYGTATTPPPPVPTGTGNVGVSLNPGSGTPTMVDDLLRKGKAGIGVEDPAVYDAYMEQQGGSLVQLANAVDPKATGSPLDMLDCADPSTMASTLAQPALAQLRTEHPKATFRLVAVERVDPSMQSSGLAIAMTENGVTQQFMIDTPPPPQPSLGPAVDFVGPKVVDAFQDSGTLDAWYAAAKPALQQAGMDYGDAATSLRMATAQGIGNQGFGVVPNFYSMRYDHGSVVVDTSIDKLLGNQADLDATYGVSDVPMTIRIPVPTGGGEDWSNPTADQLDLLNDQVKTIGGVSLFMHGYQSTRAVWDTDMQKWMDASPEPVIGISIAGMGSEGNFMGNGDSMFTAKQYAFDTMAVLDRLGLYGKELNLVGHSMGGAAVLQMGLATERLVAEGKPRPEVRYTMLEPAPSGDSVPFLTSYHLGGSWVLGASNWISLQNWAGTTSVLGIPLEGVAYGGNSALGPGIVRDLIPDAPPYIQDVHSNFANRAGFQQLRATAAGLTGQPEPDPDEVQAFLARNPVLVLAGSGDRIVGTPAVQGIFGTDHVQVIQGGHYAHLTDPAALTAYTELASRSFHPQAGGMPQVIR